MSEVPSERDDRLALLLTEAPDAYRGGETVDVTAWQARHPDLAGELPELLETLLTLDTAVDDWKKIASPETRSLPTGVETSPPAAAPTLPAQVGRYRILGRLGQGGMGTVYKAEDPQLQRVVALKVPRFEGPARGRETAAKRFLREARAMAQVRHPHVCPIHDVGEQDGVPYVVMDYVEGQSLADRLAGGRRYDDPAEAVRLAREVAAALEAVHARGLVHRDLKPGNILLDAAGRAVLTDFGLARSDQDAEHLTADGDLIGTPAYMAPEQASLAAGPVGPRTDVYSLGVVLYQMLTGRLPFDGPLLQVIYRIAHDTPPPLRRFREDLDPALEGVVLKAMGRRAEERYADAGQFAAVLERWSAGAGPEPQDRAPAGAATTPAPTVVRSELPDGSTITVSLQPGAAVPKKLNVTVREQRGKRRRRVLAVSVTVALSILLVVGLSPFLYLHRLSVAPEHGSESPPGPLAMSPVHEPPQPPAMIPATVPQEAPGPLIPAPVGTAPPDLPVAPVPVVPAETPPAQKWQEAKLQDALRQGEALAKQGKRDEALAAQGRAVLLAEQIYGRESPQTATVLTSAANFSLALGQPTQAETYLRRSLTIRQAKLGADHPDVAATLDGLAAVAAVRQDREREEKLLQQSLTIRQAKLGEAAPEVAETLDKLGALYLAAGQFDKAEAAYDRCVAIRRAKSGARDQAVAHSLESLAGVYEKMGRTREAEQSLRQSLAIQTEALGKDAPEVARLQERLAGLQPRPAQTVAAGVEPSGNRLNRELLEQAPDILKYLREHHYHNVGVLKFRVQKDGEVSDNAGPLNMNFAARLETALLLKYDMDADRDLTLLHDASATAAKIPGANHLTAEGRARLFREKYRALWGPHKTVDADAFLTGRIDFSDDLRTVTVAVSAFGRDARVQKVVVFHAGTGLNTLVEAGESFNLRPFLSKKDTLDEEGLVADAAEAARETKQGKAEVLPLDDKLVGLEIHYVDHATGDDRLVAPEVKGGQLLCPEPNEGQDVYFVLKRNDPDPQARYGAVLTVNGVNTLFEERLPPAACTKWVVEPNSPPIKIHGFQLRDNVSEKFVVRSAAESKANEVDYGANVGAISFSLFREQPGPAKKPSLDPAAERQMVAVLSPAVPPPDLPHDAGPLKAALLGDGRLPGVPKVGGSQVAANAHHIAFTNPVLVSSATIRYYKPQR